TERALAIWREQTRDWLETRLTTAKAEIRSLAEQIAADATRDPAAGWSGGGLTVGDPRALIERVAIVERPSDTGIGPTLDLPDLSAPIVTRALQGESAARAIVGADGVIFVAAHPSPATDGHRAAVVIARLPLATLAPLTDRPLALYRDGLLMATTADERLAEELQRRGWTLDAATIDALRSNGWLAVAAPVGDNGAMVAFADIGWVVATDERQRTISYVTIGVGLIIAAAAAWVFAKRVAAPITALASDARTAIASGTTREIQDLVVRELDDLGKAVASLKQQLESQAQMLQYHTNHDSITDLPNRSAFLRALAKRLETTERRAAPVIVMCLDLDNFKTVNEGVGHQAADSLLRQIAEWLRSSFGPDDLVARIGGDEFGVLLAEGRDLLDAERLAQETLRRLRQPTRIGDQDVLVTASIGIASSHPGETSWDALLRRADDAMFYVKGNGKGQATVYDPRWAQQAVDVLALQSELHLAIERRELVVHYQPVVDLRSGRLRELEALVRWRHPRRGLISPAEFIPLAERNGLILPIGQLVLEEACRQVRDWQRRYPAARRVMLNVNLSARQFQHPTLVADVRRVLAMTEFDSRLLKLEVTESVMMHDIEQAIRTLRELKKLGILIAVDDFGTGFSSLAYLRRLPIDTLKVDRSFVDRLGRDPEDFAIVRSIVALSQALNLSTTAEGIETVDHVSQLRLLHCELGQGYFFAPPLSPLQMEDLFASNSVVLSREEIVTLDMTMLRTLTERSRENAA
ncbi:MAG: EAL domain-containing protein, partial [Dehalococcoidia bacterium]|nr:EAL domain-containing protein [Dehalococcoidia bacterium]